MTDNVVAVVVKGVIIHDRRVLIVQRAANDQVGGGTWECAGGKIVFGEDLEAALIREVKEEVGLDVTVEKILYATTFQTGPTRQVVIISYLCESTNKDIVLSEEHMDYKWTTKDQIKKLMDPTIVKDFEQNQVFSIEEWD